MQDLFTTILDPVKTSMFLGLASFSESELQMDKRRCHQQGGQQSDIKAGSVTPRKGTKANNWKLNKKQSKKIYQETDTRSLKAQEFGISASGNDQPLL